MTDEVQAAPAEEVQATSIEALNPSEPQVESTESLTSEQEDAAKAERKEEKKEEKKERKSGLEKKVDKLTSRVSQAAAEAAHWKAEALKYQQTTIQPEVPVVSDKPTLSQFKNIEDFTDALTDWKINQQQKQSHAVEEQKKINSKFDTYNSRVADFQKSKPDFSEVFEDAKDVFAKSNPALGEACLESEIGPEIVYHLAKNIDELNRINSLSPIRQLVEIGKIEDRILAKKESKESKQIKSAPAPVKPVSGPASTITKSEYEMSPQELIAHRNKVRGHR